MQQWAWAPVVRISDRLAQSSPRPFLLHVYALYAMLLTRQLFGPHDIVGLQLSSTVTVKPLPSAYQVNRQLFRGCHTPIPPIRQHRSC